MQGLRWVAVTMFISVSACEESASRVAPEPPPPPANVHVSVEASGAVVAQWEPAPRASRYNVYWSTDHTQLVEAYAAYANAGTLSTDRPETEIPIAQPHETLFIAVTAENRGGESAPSDKAVAVLALEVDPLNQNFVVDHTSGIRWKRCAEGQDFDPITTTCTGAETLVSDPEAADQFGYRPPTEGPRAPRYEEIWSMSHCGVPYLHRDLRPDGWSEVPPCDEALDHLFPNRGQSYPPYFTYYAGYSYQGYICRTHVQAEMNFAVACSGKLEETSDRMRYYLVTPLL